MLTILLRREDTWPNKVLLLEFPFLLFFCQTLFWFLLLAGNSNCFQPCTLWRNFLKILRCFEFLSLKKVPELQHIGKMETVSEQFFRAFFYVALAIVITTRPFHKIIGDWSKIVLSFDSADRAKAYYDLY